MQKRLLFLLVIVTGSIYTSSAQETKREQPAKKGCSCSFSSLNQAGVLNGSKGAFLTIQSINGIKYKSWFAGVGVGADGYYRASLPVFLDVRRDLLKKKETPFLYADVGYHFILDTKDRLSQWYENVYNRGSMYTDVGVGYRFGFTRTGSWVVSAGYTYKYVVYDNKYLYECPTARCYENYFTVKSYLHRYSMRLGYQF
ncbi:MAG TPA: hypothetical protein VIM79_24955 [Niastella sp.]